MMSTRGSSVLKSVPVVSRSLRSFASQDSIPPSEPVQREVKEVRIPVPWGHIAGKWWAPYDVKPIIALHGWQDNANTWDTVAPLISPKVGLLCVDLVGHGHSSPHPPGVADHQINYVTMLRRIVRHYKWKRVSLLGHSMGCNISYLYSSIYPDEVLNFIAIEAFPPISSTPTQALNFYGKMISSLTDVFSWDPSNTPTYTYDQIIEQMCRSHKDSVTKESAKILLERGAEEVSEGKFIFTRDPRIKLMLITGWHKELILRLASIIRTNILHISGSSGLIYEDPKHYKKVLETAKKPNRKFEHHIVEGTHHVHLNNPEKVAPLINNFLSGVELI